MTQSELFDPSSTVPEPCPVRGCPAIRLPNQDKVVTCAHDLEPESRRRPRLCLNSYRNEDAEVPF